MNIKKITSVEQLTSIRSLEREKIETNKDKTEVLICGGAGCIASGSLELKSSLEASISENNLNIPVKLTGCLGPCSKGPVIKVNPSAVIYENVRQDDIGHIVNEHLIDGLVVESLTWKNSSDGESVTNAENITFFKEQTPIVLRNCGTVDPGNIYDYIGKEGYQGLAMALSNMKPLCVVEEIKESGLRGRGGGGFPTGKKWEFTALAEGDEKFVLCNADEGDPGAFMDRSVLEGDPHSLIEGMAIAAYAIGASRGFVYVRAEYPLAVSRLNLALKQARDAGLLGDNILGTSFSFDLDIRMGSGAFVCGEETALINSIEGKRGEPRPRPPFPAHKGLWGKPTLLNNVETYANIAPIIQRGASWYKTYGTEESKGTKVFALAGSINNSGLVEVPIGTPLGEVIYDIGDGIKDGKNYKAAQIGGPSGGCIPRQYLNVPLDYSSLKELGAIIGSGGLIVMDEDTCMVDMARFFLEFVQEESCGKCVPCRVGSKRMLEILTRICEGKGEESDIDKLIELGHKIQDTALCGLGQTAPNPVLSTIRHFKEEYIEHIRDKHCRAGVCPDLVRAPCQSGCPAGVDIPGFISLTGEKRYAEALKLHRERNPFAAVCARVCFHTCEDKCRRASIDEPVSVRGVKRFMVDQEITVQLPEVRENKEYAKRKIAIIGAGPAGLSCAYFLARLGYKPKIYEAEDRAGGLLIQAIPAYRLPRETLFREIRMIEGLGVDIETGKKLGRDFSIEDLKNEGYEAIYLATGATGAVDLGLPGEEGPGVVQSLPFLQQYNIRGSVPVGKKVVVVGGGNAAVDAARTALRLGAVEVTLIYRRSREEMPAYEEEIEAALHEGVVLRDLTQPMSIERDNDGELKSITCASVILGDFDKSGRRRPHVTSGKHFALEVNQIIIAAGQRLDQSLIDNLRLETGMNNFVFSDPLTSRTNLDRVFAGGDVASGPSSVVAAIASGEKGAVSMHQFFTGNEYIFWRDEKFIDTHFDPDSDPVPYEREQIQMIDIERRKNNFDEVEQPWHEAVAVRQSKRCLRCDYGKSCQSQEVSK